MSMSEKSCDKHCELCSLSSGYKPLWNLSPTFFCKAAAIRFNTVDGGSLPKICRCYAEPEPEPSAFEKWWKTNPHDMSCCNCQVHGKRGYSAGDQDGYRRRGEDDEKAILDTEVITIHQDGMVGRIRKLDEEKDD